MKNRVIVVSILILILGGCRSMDKNPTGLLDGGFHPCPDSPNCVSSMSTDTSHFIPPIGYGEIPRVEAYNRILEILGNEKRCRIITADENYIHAEFRSSLFRFVDDTEFFFPPDKMIIQVKSASRLGYSDFGVNRKRIEELRGAFFQEQDL